MTLNEQIGYEMRKERERRNYSLAYVASKMGFSSRNTVSKMELGRKQITVDDLERYCDAVGCDMYEILRKAQNACIQR